MVGSEQDAGDAASNLGVPHSDLMRRTVRVKDISLISGENLTEPVVVSARIRYNTQDSPAVPRPLDDGVAELVLENEQRAIAPGQSAVFYRGDEVLGGGVIRGANEGNR